MEGYGEGKPSLVDRFMKCRHGGYHDWSENVWVQSVEFWVHRCRNCGIYELFQTIGNCFLTYDFEEIIDGRISNPYWMKMDLKEAMKVVKSFLLSKALEEEDERPKGRRISKGKVLGNKP